MKTNPFAAMFADLDKSRDRTHLDPLFGDWRFARSKLQRAERHYCAGRVDEALAQVWAAGFGLFIATYDAAAQIQRSQAGPRQGARQDVNRIFDREWDNVKGFPLLHWKKQKAHVLKFQNEFRRPIADITVSDYVRERGNYRRNAKRATK
jgi:hypothetical protein